MTTEASAAYDARSWFENANFGYVPGIINRIGVEYPGISECAVLSAILAAWDSMDAENKLYHIQRFALRSSDSLNEGILFEQAEGAPEDPGESGGESAAGRTQANATVRVGTRVVELTQGESQHNGTVVHILPECVIVDRDQVWADASKLPRVTLRYDEFAVVPQRPAGAEGHGAK